MCPILLSVVSFMTSAAAAPPFYADHTQLLVTLDEQGAKHPVRTADDWLVRRKQILANMQLVMGPLPDRSKLAPLDVRVIEEVDCGEYVRKAISFVSEGDDRVPAYLLMPKGLAGKAPAMLCLHQTTGIGKGEPAGVGGLPNLHYAAELAARGYVTLAPDYPGFGDYPRNLYEHDYVSATMKGIFNHMRAVDLLQALPEVDPERIGVIGHSLGGHNSIYVAVFDTRLKVVVSSCGFNAFTDYMGGDLTGWSHDGYMPRIASVYHCDPKQMPFDFPELIGALAPRPVFVNAPTRDANFLTGVDECIAAANPVYRLYGAEDKLVIVHPDSEHDFPPQVREQAYAFVDGVLKH